MSLYDKVITHNIDIVGTIESAFHSAKHDLLRLTVKDDTFQIHAGDIRVVDFTGTALPMIDLCSVSTEAVIELEKLFCYNLPNMYDLRYILSSKDFPNLRHFSARYYTPDISNEPHWNVLPDTELVSNGHFDVIVTSANSDSYYSMISKRLFLDKLSQDLIGIPYICNGAIIPFEDALEILSALGVIAIPR